MVYRCVPEEKCKSGGFDEDDYDVEASGNRQRVFSLPLHSSLAYHYLVSVILTLRIIFIFKEWSCDATTGLRTFVENERKKSNGNVCCRSSVSVRSEDDYEYETDDYETDDKNNIDYDRESKKTYCSQRSGYRYTNKALSL